MAFVDYYNIKKKSKMFLNVCRKPLRVHLIFSRFTKCTVSPIHLVKSGDACTLLCLLWKQGK